MKFALARGAPKSRELTFGAAKSRSLSFGVAKSRAPDFCSANSRAPDFGSSNSGTISSTKGSPYISDLGSEAYSKSETSNFRKIGQARLGFLKKKLK